MEIEQQRQTILNLHNSVITPDIIAMQLDISKDEVYQVIKIKSVKKKEKGHMSNSFQILLH